MLIKVQCPAAQRRELSDLANIFHGTVCDVSLNTITLEMTGKEDKMHALQGLLEPYGARPMMLTGCSSCMCSCIMVQLCAPPIACCHAPQQGLNRCWHETLDTDSMPGLDLVPVNAEHA